MRILIYGTGVIGSLYAVLFAEISGNKSEKTKQFSKILRHAHIPYQKVVDMHMWQLCHLAMVVPIADAYYEADCPERAGKD